MKKITVALIGAGSRGKAYSDIMLQQPDRFQIVSVAEPLEARREYIRKAHNVEPAHCYRSWDELLAAPKIADVCIIATMDRLHYAPAMEAMKQKYHLLLEKPIAPTVEECRQLTECAHQNHVKVLVCHVLRYTPFFRYIKYLLESKAIGEIVSVEHTEAVGNIHHSHSFVRGNWGNAERSSTMLLQKSCHDLDIIQWLLEKPCRRIQSFGSLKYFHKGNAPKGAPEFCIDGCPVSDTCYYNAVRLYLEDKGNEWFRSMAAQKSNPSDAEVEKALKTTQYGKCVFKCDNDVVDHQIVNMEFDEGITVSFTMCSFNEGGRQIRIMGTDGELNGNMGKSTIEIFSFKTRAIQKISLTEEEIDESIVGGHGGGDEGIVAALYDYLNGTLQAKDVSEIETSFQNHLLAFAAEESRLTSQIIDMKTF